MKRYDALKNCIKLSSRITIYVPSTVDVDKPIDNAAFVDKTATLLSQCFGGATSSPAVGYWLSSDAGLVRENTTVVFAYASDTDLQSHIDIVVRHCAQLCYDMSQEAVALELNGEMYFIDGSLSKAA